MGRLVPQSGAARACWIGEGRSRFRLPSRNLPNRKHGRRPKPKPPAGPQHSTARAGGGALALAGCGWASHGPPGARAYLDPRSHTSPSLSPGGLMDALHMILSAACPARLWQCGLPVARACCRGGPVRGAPPCWGKREKRTRKRTRSALVCSAHRARLWGRPVLPVARAGSPPAQPPAS